MDACKNDKGCQAVQLNEEGCSFYDYDVEISTINETILANSSIKNYFLINDGIDDDDNDRRCEATVDNTYEDVHFLRCNLLCRSSLSCIGFDYSTSRLCRLVSGDSISLTRLDADDTRCFRKRGVEYVEDAEMNIEEDSSSFGMFIMLGVGIVCVVLIICALICRNVNQKESNQGKKDKDALRVPVDLKRRGNNHVESFHSSLQRSAIYADARVDNSGIEMSGMDSEFDYNRSAIYAHAQLDNMNSEVPVPFGPYDGTPSSHHEQQNSFSDVTHGGEKKLPGFTEGMTATAGWESLGPYVTNSQTPSMRHTMGEGELPVENTSFDRNASGYDGMAIDIQKISMSHKVGRGGFGEVWRGTYHGAPVAIKMVLSQEITQERIRALEEEGRTWAQIRAHPNICRLIGWVKTRGKFALVMDWVENGSLHDVLKKNERSFTESEKLQIVCQCAGGMWHLHEQGFIHRDIALRNVLIDYRSFFVKLTDFGMSRITQEMADSAVTKTTTLPIAWTAPESIKRGLYSSKSDVWSFGVLIWELIEEAVPFAGRNLMNLSFEIAKGSLTLSTGPNWDEDLAELTRSCWAFDSNQRPSAEEILNQISLIIQGGAEIPFMNDYE